MGFEKPTQNKLLFPCFNTSWLKFKAQVAFYIIRAEKLYSHFMWNNKFGEWLGSEQFSFKYSIHMVPGSSAESEASVVHFRASAYVQEQHPSCSWRHHLWGMTRIVRLTSSLRTPGHTQLLNHWDREMPWCQAANVLSLASHPCHKSCSEIFMSQLDRKKLWSGLNTICLKEKSKDSQKARWQILSAELCFKSELYAIFGYFLPS